MIMDFCGFNKVRKLTDAKTRYESHLWFLSECLEGGFIPKGFRMKWRMNLNSSDHDKEEVSEILKNTSKQLIGSSIQICKKTLKNLNYQLEQEALKMEKQLHPDKVTEIHEYLTVYEDRLSHRLRETKIKKLKSIHLDTKSKTSVEFGKTINIIGDGNCFFRCISYHLYGTQDRFDEIRSNVVNEMRHHRAKYESLVDGEYRDHLENMSKNTGNSSSWATEAEISAASAYYNMDIFVRGCVGRGYTFSRFSAHAACDGNRQFIVIDHRNEHFNLVLTENRPCECDHCVELAKNKNARNGVTGSVCDNVSDSNISAEMGGLRENSVDDVNNKNSSTLRGMKGADKMKCKEVINLSKRKLTKAELSLLAKGLKFVPTRKTIDMGRLLADLKSWERRMRLREYYHEDNSSTGNYMTSSVGKKSSTWTPNSGRDKWLDYYIENVKNDIVKGLTRNFKMNIAKGEEKALRDLMNDSSIVIRPADKGSGIVVMDTVDYKSQLEKELEDNNTYEERAGDITTTVENSLKRLVNGMYKEGMITKELKQYLIPTDCRAGKVQGNPKVHKDGNPLRTIINGRNHPTENMAEYVENRLSQHVRDLPSYIQDTTDFLKKIETIPTPLPPDTIVFCMDVKMLYPSVPRPEARDAVKEALDRMNTGDTDAVLKMMDFVLENNNFSFNGKHYVQTEGTAIGSHLGSNYASTYMGKWESELFQQSELKPLSYFRYADDIWGLWCHGLCELKAFHKRANSIHSNIQVELRYSTDRIEFLDTYTTLSGGRILTSVYSKETDKHLYLHGRSSHPTSMKNAIPYGLAVRAKRICSDEKEYQKHVGLIKEQLRRRGHHHKNVDDAIQRVDEIKREQLLVYNTRKNKNNNRVPMVLTYSRALPNIHSVMRKHRDMLYKSDKMKEVFQELPMAAFRRDNNLQDILVHRKHNNIFYGKPNRTEKCGKGCALCGHIEEGEEFFDDKGKKYTVQGFINCKTSNLVYGILCTCCEKYIYVGETGGTLYQRMLLNFSRIRTGYPDPVAMHFRSPGHSKDNLRVIGIEKISGDVTYRGVKENLWKKKLNTYKPNGVNTKD